MGANYIVPFIRFSEGNEQDNEMASADVLERIQSQSCLESDTHYIKITNLLLEAWNTIGPNKMFLADFIMAAIFV